MGVPGSANFLLAGVQGYQIERSLRFNRPDSAYLGRTPSVAGNRRTWTWSGWIKRSSLGIQTALFHAYDGSSSRRAQFYFDTSDRFVMNQGGGGTTAIGNTTAVFRDVSAWYHFLFYADYTNTTFKLYVNNVEQAISYSSSVINADGQINATIAHQVGADDGAGAYFAGYMAEVHFIDGQALTPSSFGETDTITGVWKPKKVSISGGYGTNGFYLNFKDNSSVAASTLGKDYSGNGNNWTPSATFSVTAGAGNDSLIDTPTPYADGGNGRGNYCTFNAIASNFTQGTLYNGNLEIQGQGAVVNTFARGNMAILGKAYAEFYFDVVNTYACIGVVPLRDTAANGGMWSTSTNLSYRSNGNKRIMGTETAYGATWVANNVIGVAVDPSANTVEFFKNGASQGVITSSAFFAQGECTFAVATDDVGSPRGYANFGQRAFAYTPPSGFLALNTQNLPEPTIKKPSSYMDVVTWTGNATYPRAITGLNFSPDLLWIKSRSNTYDNVLMDAVRGTGNTKWLTSNGTDAEGSNSSNANVTSLDSGGFTIGTNVAGINILNNSGVTNVAWCWDESATPGFDIVTYTGDGVSNRTVGHALGVAPAMIIIKDRDTNSNANNWFVWHQSLSSGNNIQLEKTDAAYAVSSTSGGGIGTSPSSSTFTLLNGSSSNVNTNENGDRFVAYLWSEVAGFSKFGSYTGNGSTDGPFVYCGFRPRWLMVKSSSNITNWYVFDTARNEYNLANKCLFPNLSNAENTGGNEELDIVSNGFKMRNASSSFNLSGYTYIFAAFAESPFKYSLAR